MAKIPKALHSYINSAFPDNVCLLGTVLKDGFANISPRGSTQVFDDDTLAARRADLGIKVYAAEPEGYDDMARSLELGERQENLSSPPTLCDALQAATPGEVTFAAARETLAGGFVVSDAEVRTAMERAFQDLKIVLEPNRHKIIINRNIQIRIPSNPELQLIPIRILKIGI